MGVGIRCVVGQFEFDFALATSLDGRLGCVELDVLIINHHASHVQWVHTCVAEDDLRCHFLALSDFAQVDVALHLYDRRLLALFYGEVREVLADISREGELVVFGAAMVGALIGFLWYNSFPAQIFMGDTGSLAIGGIVAVFALCIRKELLLPLLCGVFLAEAVSVMMQVSYFKYTKRKYGEGRRLLKMSPLHHHYQKQGIFETKIMMRFMIVSIILAALTLATLKIR